MVLPQEQQIHFEQQEEERDHPSKEEDGNYDTEHQNAIHEIPTPTITAPNLPVPGAPTGPACVHYVTTMGLAPCPTFTPLPLNSDGCAILTSTSLALTAATAVPERPFRKKDGIDIGVTYTYSIGTEPTITPVSEPVPVPMVPPQVPQLDDPTEIGTSFSTHFSTHYSYSLSFEFNYGAATPPSSRITGYPELPGPTAPPGTSNAAGSNLDPPSDPAQIAVADPTTAAPPAPPAPEPMPPAPAPDTTTTPVVAAPGPTPETPLIGTGSEVADLPPVAVDPPTTTSPVADPTAAVPPIPGPTPDPIHKACDACAEPCVVEVDVVVNAEVPLLVRLLQDKIKNALASLRISLENETGATATNADGAAGVFGKLSVDVNAETAGVFRKACETKIQEIEDRRFVGLAAKCQQVVESTCETGVCLQVEVDKVVRLLDFMVSTELARDASQLRVELVNEFRSRCVEEDKKRAALTVSVDADATIKKRSGLLGSLLDPVVGNTLDRAVDKVGNVVGDAVKEISPPLGDLVKGLVAALTGTVKSVVDSFVSNCNRKGLLDFDTEHGVGSLAAIANVSLDLFKLVCVKAEVVAKVDAPK